MNLLSNIFKKKSNKGSHVLLDNQDLFESEKRTVIIPPNTNNGKKSPRSSKSSGVRRDNAGEENSDDEHPTIYCVSGLKGLLKCDRKWLTTCNISEEVIIQNFNVVLTILNFLRRKDLVYYKFIDQPEQILTLKEQQSQSNLQAKKNVGQSVSNQNTMPSVIISSANANQSGSVSSSRNSSGCSNGYSPTLSPSLITTSLQSLDSNIINFDEVSNLKPVLLGDTNSNTSASNLSSNGLGGILNSNSLTNNVDNQLALYNNNADFKKKRIDQNRIFLSPGAFSKFPEEINQAIDKLLKEGNPKEHFKNLDFEAKGGFGSVFAAKNKNIHSSFDKLMVALKKMPHKTSKQKRMNLNEIGFLKFCNHPNIVKFICSYQKSDELWLIMEFMEGGTLREAISNFNFCEKRIAYISKEILKGIQYLHKNGLCHRDLKSSNIMISMKGEIKIIDFGLAIDFNNDEKEDIHMCGSPFWLPPEQIHGKPHTFTVDIWSFGVCVAEMLKGKVPNHSSRLKAMIVTATEGLKFSRLQYSDWSEDAHDFLEKCLQVDPTKRATADQLLEHPFLTKACDIAEIKEILPALFMSHTLARQGLF